MKSVGKSTVIAVIVTAAFTSVAVGGALTIAGTDQGEQLTACVKKNNGQMRLVDSVDQCRNSEYSVAWNQLGPEGPPGPSGLSRGYGANTGDTLIAVGGPPVDLMVLEAPAGDYVMNLSFTVRAEGESFAGADCGIFDEAADGSRVNLTGDFGPFANGGLQQVESIAFTFLTESHPADARFVLACESFPFAEEDLFVFRADWTAVEVVASNG